MPTLDETVYVSESQYLRSKSRGYRGDVIYPSYHANRWCPSLQNTQRVIALHLGCAADAWMGPCWRCGAPQHDLLETWEIEQASEKAAEYLMDAIDSAHADIERARWTMVMWLQCVEHHGRYALREWNRTCRR
jgi:hypothetical protein